MDAQKQREEKISTLKFLINAKPDPTAVFLVSGELFRMPDEASLRIIQTNN